MDLKLPNIFDYTDFRKFLKDYQNARYAVDKGYSKSSICMRMGLLNSRSYFNDVLIGKKVTPDFVERFIRVLDLKSDEAQFFRVLVKFNQSENAQDRELYLFQLKTQKNEHLHNTTEVVPNHLGDLRLNTAFEPTYSSFTPDRTTYGPRGKGEPLVDSLGVKVFAAHLAQLIAARESFMPLSIGLFGPWGSGKSYFMDLLEESLFALSGKTDSVFHERIVQIRFNAWHYLDTNLWANLVCEIFDQLFENLEDKPDQVQVLKDNLAQKSALAVEAKEALEIAKAVRRKAEEELQQATEEREKKEKNVRGLLEDLSMIVSSDPAVKKQLDTVADSIGFPKLKTSFSELEARINEMRSLQGRFKTIALATFNGPGWWKRGLLLIVAIAIPMGILLLTKFDLPWLKELLKGANLIIAQVATAVGLVSTWISRQVKNGNLLISKLEEAFEKVNKVRSEREDAVKEQKDLAEKLQAEEFARHKLIEVEEKIKNISAELADLAPGRQLIRFLKTRATAEDYRQHLGLISLVRKDFEQLSNLLTNTEYDKNKGLPRIDRIVLYIDDLDRCRADRVIEVLEAVHLLLAFPLFAVVVAVDPRWLRQSLLDHYPRLLGGGSETNKPHLHMSRPATPQDYLEKIFQVPFNLQCMDKPGFDALVDSLFRTKNVEPPPDAQDLSPEKNTNPAPETKSMNAIKKEDPPPSVDPKRLTLTVKEVTDMQRLQPLFQTPRAVKRMANTYCLIRVGVDEEEWSAYLGPGDTPGNYRIPLILLAVCAAFPSLARPWLRWIETPSAKWILDQTNVDTLVDKHRDSTCKVEWEELSKALYNVHIVDWPVPETTAISAWVLRVARYSF